MTRVPALLGLGLLLAGFAPLPGAAHEAYCTDDHCVAICEAGHANTDPPHQCFLQRCPPQPTHAYVLGGAPRVDAGTLGIDFAPFGPVHVWSMGAGECASGDREFGIGGGFFGSGPWADEPLCGYGLHAHGDTVAAHDAVLGDGVWFSMGADDMAGPVVLTDPDTGTTVCMTDGSITPGDAALDPTADADDCIAGPFLGRGTTCGAGGDGGYWVVLHAGRLAEEAGGVQAFPGPTTGTLTAGA